MDHILSDLSIMTLPSWVAPHAWLMVQVRRDERSYSTFNVRRGDGEEIPSVQGRSSGWALLEQP